MRPEIVHRSVRRSQDYGLGNISEVLDVRIPSPNDLQGKIAPREIDGRPQLRVVFRPMLRISPHYDFVLTGFTPNEYLQGGPIWTSRSRGSRRASRSSDRRDDQGSDDQD